MPAVTWPGISGYGTPASLPRCRCTSVPQTSLQSTRSSASPGASSGSGTSRSSTGRSGAGNTAARTVRIVTRSPREQVHEQPRDARVADAQLPVERERAVDEVALPVLRVQQGTVVRLLVAAILHREQRRPRGVLALREVEPALLHPAREGRR